MARKKLTGVERKQDILEKSARHFSLYGYDGVSMRQIAEACMVNEALLYKHFKGKEELFQEVVSSLGPMIDDSLRRIARAQPNSMEALKCVIRALVFEPEENLQIYALMVHGTAASERHEGMRAHVRDGFSKLNELIFELLEAGKKDGTIRENIDPNKCAWCLLSRGLAYRITIALKPDVAAGIRETIIEITIQLLDCVSKERITDSPCCGPC